MQCGRICAAVGAIALVGGSLLAGPSPAAAQAVYDSEGFEPPTFTPGDLEGQDPTDGPWARSGAAGGATVQAAVVQSGLQAVRLDRQGADLRYAVPELIQNVPGQVIVDWDMRVTQSSVPATSFGPFFGVEVYDDAGNAGNAVLLAGSAGIDAATGELLYQEQRTGNVLATGDVLAFDTWHRIRLVMDYASDQYSIFVNGNLEQTEGFVDAGVNDFTDADLSALSASGDPGSLAAAGTAYYDNFRVAVPEPGSLSLLGLAGVAILARRRRCRCS